MAALTLWIEKTQEVIVEEIPKSNQQKFITILFSKSKVVHIAWSMPFISSTLHVDENFLLYAGELACSIFGLRDIWTIAVHFLKLLAGIVYCMFLSL